MKNKKLILLISVATLAVVTSVLLWLVFSKSENNSNNSTTSQPENTAPVEPERTEAPADFDTSTLKEIPRETSFVYTDQILSPDSLASNPNDYLDKKVTVRGWILEPSQGMYIITSINSDEQKALILAKNDSVNFGEYANTSTDYSKSSKPVTLVGSFLADSTSGNLEFVVESLNQ